MPTEVRNSFNLLAYQRLVLAILACLFVLFSDTLWAANLTVQVTDKAGATIENAVVYAESVNKSNVVATAPAITGAMSANIEQKNKRFIPLVTVVQTGSNISFPNRDTVRHHVYSFSPVKTFELKLYSGVPTNPILFDKAGTAVLGCNIHDQMVAFVQIVDTPYFAKTDNKGKATITGLPNGQYVLKAWHYALAKENKIVESNIDVSSDLQANVVLELKPFTLPK